MSLPNGMMSTHGEGFDSGNGPDQDLSSIRSSQARKGSSTSLCHYGSFFGFSSQHLTTQISYMT